MSSAHIIKFPSFLYQNPLLSRLQSITKDSSHGHEMVAHELLCDLDAMIENRDISKAELGLISHSAEDTLSYFKYDIDALAKENTWYRASVIHQICCGILKTIRLIRPDLNQHPALNETAYDLYRYREPEENYMC